MRRNLFPTFLTLTLVMAACGGGPMTGSVPSVSESPGSTDSGPAGTTGSAVTATTAISAEDPEATNMPTTTVQPIPGDRGDPRPLPTVTTVPSASEPPAVTGEVPDEYMVRVMAHAADRAKVAADAIAILRSQEMQWPDGSLGCGEPGGIYTQAIVPGYWVELSVSETLLDYRLDSRGNFMLCERSRPMFPPTSVPGDTTG